MRSFNVIAARNLGEKADVLSKSSKTLGQAEISINANALNGNLLIKDHMFTYIDRGVDLEIGMVYNSQSAQPWKLNLGKKIVDVKDVNTVSSKITLSEEDGAKTTFAYVEARKCYVEVGATNGARKLTYDGKQWKGFNPANGARETYDQSLNLVQTEFLDGASIEYHHDTDGKLIEVRTTSGQYIEIEYQGCDVKLWHHQDGERKLWVTYSFNMQKKQFKSSIPVTETENYETIYGHEQRTGLLQHITQSDNTEMEFDYILKESVVKICSIKDGEGRKYGIIQQPQQVVMLDPLGNTTIYSRDKNERLEWWSDGQHFQTFKYDELERLEKITYANDKHEAFYYDDLSFLKKHEDRNGDERLFKHDQETGVLLSIHRESSANVYYYNAKRQLCFEVTPVGGVIEYQYDQLENCTSKKSYLKDTFVFDRDIQTWLKAADQKQVALTEWQYYTNGQVFKEIRYATIDENGRGVFDEFTAEETYEWDKHGNCLKTIKRLDEFTYATTKAEYDGLSRIVEKCDAVGRITRHTYKGLSHTISSLATGHEKIIQKDKSGSVFKQIERSDGLVRETVKLLDCGGRCCVIQHDDGSKTYYIYDKQNRKQFEIDAEKRITEYCYDTNDNVTQVIRYAQPIQVVDEAGLQKGTWQPRVTGPTLVKRKKYDAENRLRFAIDGENYVTEYRYDKLGYMSDKIVYATACVGEPPAASSEQDRHYRYFYNDDGSKQAELTPIEQVIVYVRNKNGDLLEQKRYVSPQTVQDKLDIDKLISSKHDEKDVYVLDALGQCKEHLDAENLLTYNEYDAGGNLKSKKKETLKVEYEHDELGRVVSESHSTGLEIGREYHPNGKLCYELKSDRLTASESQALYMQYNGFGEQTTAVTDKASIATLMEKESKANMRSRRAFSEIIEKALGDNKGKRKGLSSWSEIYFYLVTDKKLNKDNAAIILDEMERQSYYFSAEAEIQENTADLIRFIRLYSAALNIVILKSSWHTYFGGKLHLEYEKHSFFPIDFNLIPHSLDTAKKIIKEIASITETNDLSQLRSIKSKLLEIKKLLDDSLVSKGFWRDDITHNFYDKTVKTLHSLASSKKNAAVKIDEENIYSPAGLLIATRDVAGYTTHYFYDALRRPIYIVNKDRSIVEKKYDSYSNHAQVTRCYNKFMSAEDKTGLTGGTITPLLLTLFDSLKNDVEDIITIEECDKRQLVVKSIDGEEFSEESTFNAFGEIEKHSKEIDKEKHEFTTDTFEHDKAGRLLNVSRDVGGLGITESNEYNDALGEEVHTDGNGNKEKHYYDRLHRLIKVIDAHAIESSIEWDGLSRIKAEVNKLKQLTIYEWSNDGCTLTKKSPSGVSVVESNAFGKVTLESRLAGDVSIKIIKEYDDHGRVRTVTDANCEVTTFLYDARGFLEFEVPPTDTMTKYIRDEMGRLKEKIEDFGGLNRRTIYQRDSQGRIEAECNGERVWTKHRYNKRSDSIETIIDPEGLHLKTRKDFDGLGKLRSETHGDRVTEDQFHQSYSVDHIGRRVAESVDPAGIDINTSNKFDAVGNVTSFKDANGRVTWLYYDALSCERFQVSPEGEVTEKQYDALGRCMVVRNYVKPFKDDDYAKYKLKDMEQKAVELSTSRDMLLYYVYDITHKPRFKIRVLNDKGKTEQGLVEEFVYDNAERETKRVRFAKSIDISGDKSIREQLDTQIDMLRSNVENRVLRRWHDTASQERFVIDQAGRVTETRYGKNGRVTQVIQYAKAIGLKALAEDTRMAEVSAIIAPNPVEDRVTSYVYDKLGRKIFKMSPNGSIKKYDYDNNNKRISVCLFKNKIDVRKSYDDLEKLLKEIKPDPEIDSITSVKYDHAGRIEKVIDAFNKEDIFKYDALGNVRFHIDRNGKEWENQFDRAKRLVREITPKSLVAHVTRQQSGQLSLDLKEESVITKKDYYLDGSPKSVTKGEGLHEQRNVNFKMNSKGALIETEVPKAVVDDPAANASLSTIPVQQKDIKTIAIYNHLQKEVAKQDESGNWSYKAYDTLGRAIFDVDREGAVTEYSYNAFDEVTIIKEYSTKIIINHDEFSNVNFLSDYLSTMLKSDDKADRITTFFRDASGNVSEIVQDEIDFFVDDKLGRACPTTKRRYNIAGKCISEAKLIRPNCWAEKSTWYDNGGLVIAEIDQEQYLTIYERNAQGNIVKRHEYANPLKSRPDALSPFEELQKSVVESVTDRHFEFFYNRNSKPDSIIQKNVITHKLVIGKDGKPELVIQPPKDICKTIEYDAAGYMTAMVHEDGARDEYIYDAQGLLIAEVGAAREIFDTDGSSSRLRPAIVHHYNAFGERTSTRCFKKGFPDKVSEKDIIAEDILNHPQNQLDIELHDSRGLLQIKQDAVGNLSFFTHTPTKQSAREYQKLTMVDKQGVVTQVHVDETRKRYDKEGRDTITSVLRDSVVNHETYKLYTAFSECIFEGPDGQNWPLYREFAKNRRVIRSNEYERIHTIKLGCLSGYDTLHLQAANDDLTLSSLDKLTELMALDRDRIERTETMRDKRGRPITMKAPIWHLKNNGLPTRTYAYDRWDNPVHEVDSLGNETFREYNHDNKEIRTTRVFDPALDDVLIKYTAEILHGYNERGIYVGTVDPNKHTSGVLLDDAGQWVVKIDAEGVRVESRQIDIFGNTLVSSDASGRAWHATYNPINLPEEMEIVQSELGRKISIRYDEARQRNSVSNTLGVYRYNHDPMGNIIERYLPSGQLERRRYARKNFLSEIAYEDGTQTTWLHDYFGNVCYHTDLMGEMLIYQRDFKMQPYHEYSGSGKHPVMSRHLEFIKFNTQNNTPDMPITKYYTTLSEDAPKNVEREFRCGLLMSLTDHVLGKKEKREYDSEGRPELMMVNQLYNFINFRQTDTNFYGLPTSPDGFMVTTISVSRDGMGREVKVVNSFMTAAGVYSQFKLNKIYDLTSNLKGEHLQLSPAGYSETCPLPVQHLYRNYAYYDNDYVSLIESIMSDPVLAGTEAVHHVGFGYTNGYRTSETHNYGAPLTIDYAPHDPLVVQTLMPGVMRTIRSYWADGVARWYAEHGSVFDRKERFPVYDANGWQLSDEIKYNDKTTMLAIIRNHDLYNFPVHQEVSHHDDKGKLIMSDYFDINQTTGFESWLACGYHGRRVRYGVGETHADSRMMIDANQTISGKYNAADEHSDDASIQDPFNQPSVFFDSTPSGHLLSKHNVESLYSGSVVGKQRVHYFLRNIAGDVLAAYSELHNLSEQAIHAESHKKPDPHKPKSHCQPLISFIRSPERVKLIGRLTHTSTSAHNDPMGWDDVPNPPLAPQLYVTVQGDTFASIAFKQFGDEEAVVALARENGYLGDYMLHQPLRAGEVLFLPQYFTHKVKAPISRPYHEFVTQMTGSILPFLKMPMPRPKSEGGMFMRILIRVIAAAIVFAVAPYLGAALVGAFVGAGASLATSVAFNAVAGAALDASLQGVAMAVGLQGRFSLSQSLSAGIGVGVNTAIFGSVTQFGQAAGHATSASAATQTAYAGMTTTLMRTAEAAVTTQLLEMAAGLRSKFDASAIATQMASTLVAMKVDSKIAEALGDSTQAAAVAGGARAVTSTMIGSAVSHTSVNADVVAAQAIGGMVGGSLDSRMQEKWKKPEATSSVKPQKSAASPTATHSTSTSKPRPLTAHEKHILAEAGDDGAFTKLADPRLDVSQVGYGSKKQKYDLNQTRAQRWSNAAQSGGVRHGSATADLLRAAREASGGEPYSTLANTSEVGKVLIYGGGAALLASAALPVAVGETILSFGTSAAIAGTEILGHASLVAVGIPVAEGILVTESATIAGGMILTATAARVKTAVSAATSRYTLFGRDGAESVASFAANNHVNGLRLQRSLSVKEAESIFTEPGYLKPEIISKSDVIIPGQDFSNPKLIQELTRSGGDISDWGKYATKSIPSPSGSFQMHFYRNSMTGEVYYGRDYKAVFDHQGAWNFKPQPNFHYEPPRFNQ